MMATNSGILQINTNHFLEAVSLAVKTALNFRAVVIAIPEPYLFCGKMLSASPFECVYVENAALLVQRDVKFKRLQLESTDIAGIQIGEVLLLLVYMSPNQSVNGTCNKLEKILKIHKKVIVMGVLNCRLQGFTTRRQHPRDLRVQRLINELGLEVVNSGTLTMDHNGTLGINDYTLVR